MPDSHASHPPPARWWDLPGAILLLGALSVLTARLTATEWVPHLEIAQAVNLFAWLAGLALGYSRFRPAVVRFFNLCFGSLTILWQLGSTQPSLHYWALKLAFFGQRWQHILHNAASGEDILDPVFFLTLSLILVWSLSSVAAYLLVRQGQTWFALTPPGLALFILHINDKFWPFRAWYLALYGLLSALLLARMHYLHNRARWQQRHTRLPAYLGLDITRAALLLTLLLALGVALLPTLPTTIPQVRETWESATSPLRERFRPFFASLRATVGVVSDYYGENLNLGVGQPLSNAVVMEVEAPPEAPAGVRFYWRARVYDRYADNTWESSLTEQAPITSGLFDARPLLSQPRWEADLTFHLLRPFGTLHVVPQPLSVNQRGTAYFARNPDGSLDIGYLQADPLLNAGATYTVHAALTRATIADLRNAGSDYPDWVRQRYLQLPPDITDRTRTLARELADGAQSPYDIAARITQYLRQSITYQTSIEAPPNGQEAVDWLLFDYRRGFCNYYATAEVVLLRSLGIPARLAVGYAQGEYHTIPAEDTPGREIEGLQANSSAGARYTVRQKDLHAWPEVYFPGIGWVEFEPTANQSPILRLRGDSITAPAATQQASTPSPIPTSPLPTPPPLPAPGAASSQNTAGNRPAQRAMLRLGALLLALGLLYLLTPRGRYVLQRTLRNAPATPDAPPPLLLSLESQLRRRHLPVPAWLRRRAAWLRLHPTGRAYHEINRALRLLDSPPPASATPAERARRLTQILPAMQSFAAALLQAYQRLHYAPHTPPPEESEPQLAARQIRSAAWLAWLNRKLARWQE